MENIRQRVQKSVKAFNFKKSFLIASVLLSFAFPKKVHNTLVNYLTNFSSKKLIPIEGKEFKRLNYLNPCFEQIAFETDTNAEHLREITWLESEGNPDAKTFEESYYDKYIKGKPLNPKFKRIYHAVRRSGYKENIEQFKKDLAHSHGLGQVLLTTAYEIGYRGHPDWLFNKKIGLKLAAKYIKAQYKYTKGNPWLVSTMYNTGRINGKPAPGRNQRLAHYLLARDKRN